MSDEYEVEGGGIELGVEMPSNMKAFLRRFFKMFEVPKTLPLSRKFDHHIPLKEKAKSINVALYQYAYYQKFELRSKSMRCRLIDSSAQALVYSEIRFYL